MFGSKYWLRRVKIHPSPSTQLIAHEMSTLPPDPRCTAGCVEVQHLGLLRLKTFDDKSQAIRHTKTGQVAKLDVAMGPVALHCHNGFGFLAGRQTVWVNKLLTWSLWSAPGGGQFIFRQEAIPVCNINARSANTF